MRNLVTAIVVAQSGEWLDATLEALGSQTLPPDRIIGVINGRSDKITQQYLNAGITRLVATGKQASFGAAIAAAERQIEPLQLAQAADDAVSEWLWLLTEDSAPEPKALRAILSVVMSAPSVAVAGPKLIDWEHPERIVELGQSLTRYGSRWLLRRQELDQQQYDHLQDTLGVGPIGVLVRRDVWRELNGFDPALPIYDDSLDFCVRARLAGHRVIVAPKSRVRVALSGIAGPRSDRRATTRRHNHYHARASHMHRRIVYANPVSAFCMWLLLPLLGLFRIFWALLREQPGNMLGELLAALKVFFNPGAIISARRRLRKHNVAGWGAVGPLRADPKDVRTARMIDREAILAAQGRSRKELHFISTGGLATLLISIVMSAALTWWLAGEQQISAGGTAPLSNFTQLWRNTQMADGIPADPFTWVLAALGSTTFFNPSLAVVLFLALAIPLATVGGWFWGAQFTDTTAGRVLSGFGWALSPVLLGSLDHARLQTVALAVILPWLLIAATRAHQSWSWAGTASLLAAAGLATAPVLIPMALVMWVAGMLLHPRQITRVAATAIAPAALLFPIVWHSFSVGNPILALRDPGLNTPYEPGNLWHLLLGFPRNGLEGWAAIFANFGLADAPTTLLVGVLLAPLALLAAIGIYLGKVNVTIFASILGGLGLITAIFSANTYLTTSGENVVPLWTGSGLALYWIAVITLAASGSSMLGKAATPIAAIAIIANMVVVTPLLASLATGQSEARDTRTPVPAIIQAAGSTNENMRTLALEALGDNSIKAEIITGSGTVLDEIRTGHYTAELSAADQQLAELVAILASEGSPELNDQLVQNGVSFVLLRNTGDTALRSALQEVFDQQVALEVTGPTEAGQLWTVVATEAAQQNATASANQAAELDTKLPILNISALQLTSHTLWAAQIVLLLAMLLLALPTGEVTETPPKRPRRRKRMRVRDTDAAVILHEKADANNAENGKESR
ncbi:glycosyltransferase family 2 protein [Canibacter zhoujuaniae]|uniref:glycosyltransferase family 2 protein n=1 Tax=Canibacter zhoujuaniae TaxID=2708343 RepID=UPI0014201BF0|nr:glycosyltransferase [Canibacter zhoujuaniae]